MTGQTISHFEVLEKLGQGGMGVVYKARDTQLDRFVALKVLPAHLVADPERRRRFIQEARAASALNHPNIITVYEISSYAEGEFIAMEFVRGKTLDASISRKGMELDRALKYAVQMAEALAVAHASGIIHRDIKPANIMVTDSGLVKVLDFGLAKLTEAPPVDLDGSGETRTVDEMLRTAEGMIAGTAAYMSPEQAEGKTVDSRSDIFSFGAVLYEMITGQRPFQGASPLSILTSVLRDDPQPISAIAGSVPPELERIINRCLRKDPDRRWHSMKDVQVALAELKDEADSVTMVTARPALGTTAAVQPPATKAARSPLMKEAIVAALVLLAVVMGLIIWRRGAQRPTAAPSPDLAPRVVAVPADKPSPLGEQILRNNDIIQLVENNVSPSLIIGQIRTSKSNFDLSTPELIRLANAHVPENIITAMRSPQSATIAGDQPAAPIIRSVTIPEGQRIRLALQQTIAASTAKKGESISFLVAENVRVAGAVVIARGAPATGTVAAADKKKLLVLRGSKLVLQLGSVEAVDGSTVRLRAAGSAGHTTNQISVGKEPGETEGQAPKAKDVVALRGTVFPAYVDADKVISVRDTPSANPAAAAPAP